ncbi:MAG: hypothetical protein SFT94_12135, partial [Pseudanabaenaceae cyanobacterium bins.68]|nr:hypothetical protein [Pseudanabaenaceae cyanobacterium bins.68]
MNNTSSPPLKTGIKESAFLFGIFGWSALGAVLGGLAQTRSRLANQFLFSMAGLCGLVGILYLSLELDSPIPRFLFCLGIVILLVAIDCQRRQFYDHLTIHLVNSAYLGVAFYFSWMQLDPQAFEHIGIWEKILPSAATSFTMLILCLICLNLGYYLVYPILIRFLAIKKSWFSSVRNPFNLLFIRKSSDELFLFLVLTSLGLVTRIWNFTLGRVFYIGGGATEEQSIPALISSFLSQFDPLYSIAWLYGIIVFFQQDYRKTQGQKLIAWITVFLVILELLYQIFSGSKGRFAGFVLIPLAFAYYLATRRVSWGFFSLFSVIALTSVTLVYPTLAIYRNEISIATSNFDPFATLTKSWQAMLALPWEQYLETVLTPFNTAGPTEQVTAMTSIVHFADRLPIPPEYLWERLLWFWLPRFLSPGKLTSIPSNAIGRLTERLGPADFTTSVIQTGPGELFIYYQLFGCLMMIIPGLLFRWFNEAASPFRLYSHFRMAIFI